MFWFQEFGKKIFCDAFPKHNSRLLINLKGSLLYSRSSTFNNTMYCTWAIVSFSWCNKVTVTSIWHKNMHRYLSLDVVCLKKRTVFWEEKYASILIFVPNRLDCVHYPSKCFFGIMKTGEYHLDICHLASKFSVMMRLDQLHVSEKKIAIL